MKETMRMNDGLKNRTAYKEKLCKPGTADKEYEKALEWIVVMPAKEVK